MLGAGRACAVDDGAGVSVGNAGVPGSVGVGLAAGVPVGGAGALGDGLGEIALHAVTTASTTQAVRHTP
jgi:hypothetical protein